jgi:hypothetical protein
MLEKGRSKLNDFEFFIASILPGKWHVGKSAGRQNEGSGSTPASGVAGRASRPTV